MHEPGDLRIISEGTYLMSDGYPLRYLKVRQESPCIILRRLSDNTHDNRYVVLMNDDKLIVEQQSLKIGENNASVCN